MLDKTPSPLLTRFPQANGTLAIELGLAGAYRGLTFVGGPFRTGFVSGEDIYGVCLTENPDTRSARHMPIEDFSVPATPRSHVEDVLRTTLTAALDGKTVYVGCMGGWGRTGLFLALLAKACGVSDPVAYVREHYTPRAVETAAQERYVTEFDTRYLTAYVRFEAWRRLMMSGFAQLIAPKRA